MPKTHLPVIFNVWFAVLAVIGLIAIGVVLFVGSFVAGLSQYEVTDLTGEEDAWGGFRSDAIYVTQRPLLFDGNVALLDHLMWQGNARSAGRSRVTFEEYVANPSKYPGVTLVPEGTRLAGDRVEWLVTMNYSTLSIYGHFVGGALDGQRVALDDLAVLGRSEAVEVAGLWIRARTPDPEFIREE